MVGVLCVLRVARRLQVGVVCMTCKGPLFFRMCKQKSRQCVALGPLFAHVSLRQGRGDGEGGRKEGMATMR